MTHYSPSTQAALQRLQPQPATSDQFRPMTTSRRFISITRTVQVNGAHTIDAIDQDGRAWWLVVGHEDAPEEWVETLPLPSREDRP